MALAVDAAVHACRQDDWRSNPFKVKRVKNAIRTVLEKPQRQGSPSSSDVSSGMLAEGHATYHTKPAETIEDRVDRVLTLVQNQHEY